MAESLGYATFCARGSRGPADVICFKAEPKPGLSPNTEWYVDGFRLVPLTIQCGTTAKPIARTLQELDKAPRPIGSKCIVARRHRAKNRRVSWTWHSAEGKFESLEALLKGK